MSLNWYCSVPCAFEMAYQLPWRDTALEHTSSTICVKMQRLGKSLNLLGDILFEVDMQ